jgi:hypothetical protein
MKRVLLLLFFVGLSAVLKAQDLRVSANVSESSCSGTLHTVSVKASGGQAPYTYKWSDGGTTAFRNDLKGGAYNCVVTDASGKSDTYAVSLKSIPSVIKVEVVEFSVNGQRTLKAEASGGVGPYTYTWLGRGMNPQENNSSVQAGLSPGKYQVIVQDKGGCPVTQSITIN